MGKTYKLILAIIFLAVALGLYFYPLMPQPMASHWDAAGRADSYLPKFWGLFLVPLLSLGLFFLFILIPKIDPLKENLAKFRKYYDRFALSLVAFLLYLYVLTLAWNLGFQFNIILILTPALSGLFYSIGDFLKKTKPNWFIGIRSPWTLSSNIVWDKTHQLGSKLFKLAGVISLLGMLAPQYAIFFVLVPVLLASAYLVIYSYFEYQKLPS